MEERETYDSHDEALMETFPASDPIAVDVVRPLHVERAGGSTSDQPKTDQALVVVDEWQHLLQRSRASVSLAPRRRRAGPLKLAS